MTWTWKKRDKVQVRKECQATQMVIVEALLSDAWLGLVENPETADTYFVAAQILVLLQQSKS